MSPPSLVLSLLFLIAPHHDASLHLRAVETWTQSGAPDATANDTEIDRVSFYHSVPIETEVSDNGRPANAAAQQKLANQIKRRIDAAGDGNLLNLDGEIWPMSKFESLFTWTVDPQDATLLHFTPAPQLHPSSRMQRVLSRTAGELKVNPATGQILGGSFHSLGPVKFGGGLLANIAHFDGTFAMQQADDCWVMKSIVVHVQGREMFSRIHGTETMTYTVENQYAAPDWGTGVPIPAARPSGSRGDSRAGARANQSRAAPDWGTGVPIPAARPSGSRGDSRAGARANQSRATPDWGT
ncbi:MAG TPA: hypothetical protein VN709_03410, partial [Terriglobales bacterium]|nr:hypothetical protein [Terriglobales bacterium]